MRTLSFLDRCLCAAQTVFLITVLGVLFAWPLRAAPLSETPPFRIEVDLSSPSEWILRATGPVRVGANGQFEWPFEQEGFSPASARSFTHRPMHARTPAHQLAFESGFNPVLPRPAELGYAPGDLVEIGLVRQIQPIAGGGLDQAFVLPNRTRFSTVKIELIGLKSTIRFDQVGLTAREKQTDSRGNRAVFEPEQRRASTSALHDFSSAPRFFLSTYPDYQALGAAVRAYLGQAQREAIAGPAHRASERASFEQGLKPLLSEIRSGRLTPIERAMEMRARLASHQIGGDILFTNRRALVDLPSAPVGLFDTVLVAIPEVGLLVDPSGPEELGFVLDPDLAGRDALRLSEASITVERLPLARAADNRIVVRAGLQIGPDGSIEGQSLTETRGPATVLMQQFLARIGGGLQPGDLSPWLQRQSLDGEARLGPTDQHNNLFAQHLTFRLHPATETDTVLRVSTVPGPRLFRPPFIDLIPALQDQDIPAVPCRPVTLEHVIVLHLPDKRLLVELPRDVSVNVPMGSYRARYQIEQTRIIIHRKLEFEPERAFCTREQVRELAPLIRATSRDISRQLHLKQPTG